MKMRKSTWLLLVLALAAILLVAGCSPTTPPNGEEPNGEEPPVTPPPADTACPKVVSTKVTKTGADSFRVVITFDEDFDSSCIDIVANWAVDVTNPGRVGEPVVTITGVEVDGKVVTVSAQVVETGEAGEDISGFEIVLFTEDFEDLDEAIAAANDLIEAVGIVDGRVLFGADWLAFLGALDVAESIPDLFADVRDLVDDVDLFIDGLAAPATITAAEAAKANVLADAATALAEEADDLGLDTLRDALNALALALGDGAAVAGDDLSAVNTGAVAAAVNAVALVAALDGALDALNDAFELLGVMAVPIIIPGADAPVFAGLICNKADAERYAETFGLDEDHVPTFADEVSWELSDCAVYDDLGNVCCDFEGKDCCVEPYCEECPEEGCDLTEPGACL